MLADFQSHIRTKFPELRETPFLLACSGGVDSMVLTDLCAKCGMDFSLAHCNFQLRGADSDADEKLVVDTAHRLGKKYHVSYFDTNYYVVQHKVSVQMAARKLRYGWFAEIMQRNGLRTLVTAHHADDNLETFLINLSRGTGVGGLTGIPEKTDGLARPLLIFSREDIMNYANEAHIEWREDSSNAETKYLRNDIRHRIVPLLKKLNPNFLENFQKTQHYLAQTAAIADDTIRQIKNDIFIKADILLQEAEMLQPSPEILKIPVRELRRLKPSQGYLYDLFKEYGFTEWNDVEHLLYAMSGKEVRSQTHRLVRDRDFLLLAAIAPMENGPYEIRENETKIEKPFSLDVQKVGAITETGAHILYVPKKALKYPLVLRKWKEGDYFCPLGMRGKKKLSKFFKDEKMDVIAKEDQWLLCSGGAIVWVVGRRADERFKVSGGEGEILKFELKL